MKRFTKLGLPGIHDFRPLATFLLTWALRNSPARRLVLEPNRTCGTFSDVVDGVFMHQEHGRRQRPAALYFAASLALLCSGTNGMEIRPIGCMGAYGKDVNTEVLVFSPPGNAPSPCGELSIHNVIPVNCSNRTEYLFEQMANQPVHESITRKAYLAVRGKPIASHNFSSPWIAGTVWNDDPEWLLRKFWFDHGLRKIRSYARVMDEGERTPRARRLTIRSHFGDMQFLHAMRGIDDSDTAFAAKLNAWTTAMHNLAIGRSHSRTSLKDAGIEQQVGPIECALVKGGLCLTLRDLFDQDGSKFLVHYPEDEGELFMRNMAAGSILHILQDAHSSSHTKREVGPDGTVARRPQTYDQANRESHCGHDMATSDTHSDIKEALRISVQYLELLQRKAPVEDVRQLFRTIGLPLSSQ